MGFPIGSIREGYIFSGHSTHIPRHMQDATDLPEELESAGAVVSLRTQPSDDVGCAAIDAAHKPDLVAALSEVGLVDADGVDPQCAGRSLSAKVSEGAVSRPSETARDRFLRRCGKRTRMRLANQSRCGPQTYGSAS